MSEIDITSQFDQLFINDILQQNNNENSCSHSETSLQNGIIICTDCGEELEQTLQHEQEWRYNDKKGIDNIRVQARKTDNKSILKDVENMGFSENIVNKANDLYQSVTNDQIYRGQIRKSIIFACVFHAYKISNNYQPHDILMKAFGISKKSSIKGLRIVNLKIPKDYKIQMSYITPEHLIHEIFSKFSIAQSDISQKRKDEVIELYNKIKNKSSKLNRARTQSVAASLIFYYIKLNNIDISLKDFAKKVDLSELTISRNAKEVAIVLGTPDVIK